MCEENAVQPFTWNGAYGYEYVPATGLYHVGAREYDPRTGRWLQRDPIDVAGGHSNVYLYCGNDPVNQVDLDGLQDSGLWKAVDIGIGFVPIVGALWDIGVGLYEGDYCRVAFGVASLVVDVATVGSARVAAGTARAAVATARTIRGAAEVRTLVLLAKGGARIVIDPAKLRFASSQKLTGHFRKHGHEFGVKTEQEYLKRAQDFVARVSSNPQIQQHVTREGKIYLYDPCTNEFAALSADGKYILTYFRPERQMEYWKEQLKK